MRRRAFAPASILVLACSGPPGDVADGGPGLGGDGDAPPYCEAVRGEPQLGLELVAVGLNQPVHLTAPRGDRRLFVNEQHAGRIRIIDPDGSVREQPFVDIGDEIAKAVEQGLLGLAFHPDYPQNGRFFISYTAREDDRLHIEAWQVSSSDPNVADPEPRETILAVEQNRTFHNGGNIQFGPDGYLYASLGDSGPWGDADGDAQSRATLRGKILRIDVDAPDGDRPYGIPDDNPFAGDPDARGEIFAQGLRNPWGVSIDSVTGHMFIGDVGGSVREELDVIPYGSGGGQNFGWPIYEGTHCRDEDACDGSFEPPLYEYENGTDGCAILGGPAYRGCRMPGHHGKVFFADLCSGWVRSLSYSASSEPPLAHVAEWPGLAYPDGDIGGIGTGGAGELYVMSIETGEVLRIVPD